MGKAWKAASVFGGLTLTTFIAYTQSSQEAWYSTPLLIISIVAAILFLITGATYLALVIKRHLRPLDILNDIQCTYWTKEKQLKVTLWFCDYSDCREFRVSCMAQFGNQIVDVNDRIDLDGMYLGNTICARGRKRMVELFKNKVEIINVDKPVITIKMKPSGIWAARQKTKEVDALIVNH